MSYNHYLPKGKVSLVPKKHHGFQFLLFLMGLLLPPIARFGIGSDFFINVFLCICGYFPCHFHNFYIQNIRNNTNRNRTPKWALKAGLVDNSDNERHARKNLWAKRFDERNLQSTHIGANLAEGEEGDNYDPVYNDPEEMERRRNEGLWTGAEEEYYNPDAAPNQRHWHYPANFEGAVPEGSSRAGNGRAAANVGSACPSLGFRSKADHYQNRRGSSDNFSFTNGSAGANGGSSYPAAAATDDDVPEWGKDYGSRKKNKKKFGGLMGGGGSKQNRPTVGNGGTYVDDVRRADGWGADDVGGVDDYGGSSGRGGSGAAANVGAGRDDPYAINAQANGQRKQKSGDVFDHEF